MSERDVFDVRQLDDQEIGHLEYVLNSPSYGRVFRPYLVRLREGLNHRLLDPSKDRKDQYPDDFLRGGITVVDGLLAFFGKLIEETSIERITAARAERTDEDQYTAMRLAGQMRAGQGPIEDKRPYDPAEDY